MPNPNYISEINMFYDWLETNQIPKSAIALWHGLMHIANKAGWEKSFTVAVSTIESKTGFKRSELFEARNILTQKGRINWRQRGGNLCAEYEIIFFSVHNTDTKAYTKAYTSADTKAYTKPTQKHTINKTKLEETKLNQTSFTVDESPVNKKKVVGEKNLYWPAFVKTFENFYLEKKNNKYEYLGQDWSALDKIHKFLKKRAELKNFEFTQENLVAAFKFFLNAAWEKDNWLKNNFSISNLLSQINQIANAQSTNQAGKQATGASVSTSSILSKINAMPN